MPITWGFLAIAVMVVIAMFISAIREDISFVVIAMIVIPFVLYFSEGINVFAVLFEYPLISISIVAAYLAGGVVYVFPKWHLFVAGHKRRYVELKQDFLDLHNVKNGNIPDDKLDDWRSKVVYAGIDFNPSARRHKARIISWMTVWPFNLICTLVDDPIRRFFQNVYYRIASVLQGMSDKAFADVSEDMQAKKK